MKGKKVKIKKYFGSYCILVLLNEGIGKEYYQENENYYITKYYQDSSKQILVYEGEYLNGERNGKGKEFYENGKLKFEGKYLNGKKNGKGKDIMKMVI